MARISSVLSLLLVFGLLLGLVRYDGRVTARDGDLAYRQFLPVVSQRVTLEPPPTWTSTYTPSPTATATPTPTPTPTFTPTPTPTFTPTPTPTPHPIRVYDAAGVERDLAWLRAKYGSFLIKPAAAGTGPVYKISVLRERVSTYSAVVISVTDARGVPLPGIQVAWYWPDAPQDANCGPAGGVLPGMVPNVCIHEATKSDGMIGFSMGIGAYYWPDRGQIGPHAAWIYGASTRSDLILGLGMVAATEHDHFDVEFTRYQ